jgi:curli biogenesis system outer membrane secretion channel CsgG
MGKAEGIMKKTGYSIAVCLLVILASCAGKPAVMETGAAMDLDTAIEETAAYFAGALPADTWLAVVGIEAETTTLSRYVAEEIQGGLQRSGKFRFVERENLVRIMDELDYQSSGLVDDDSVQGMGHLTGAETIIYGNITSLGGDYRLTVYASAVRSGELLQQTKTARLPPRLETPPVNADSPDAAIDKAV